VTVDRARFGRTVIGNGVKIDNLVQVALNVVIGENTIVVAQTGFAGSARIGRHVQIGGQAGVMGHLSVGDHAVLAGRAGVTKDVLPATMVSGFPAMAHDKARKMHAHLMRLPEWKAKIDEMEKRLKKLEIESAMGEGRSA
jgi:UDP-3-O-[3-hydroxymyristoyl] glucosamine N-acyltransferase